MGDKKVKLRLAGLNGNAFSLLAAFRRQAIIEGWEDKEIKNVLDDAMSGNYDHLLQVLIKHCDEPDKEEL